MATKKDFYESPLTGRYYRGSKITEILSERNKVETWRQLWIWLAEAENELGLKQVTKEAIEELKANETKMNFEDIAAEEKRLKHDVIVTIGKRTVIWAQELLMAFQNIEEVYQKLRFRGIKGATGTQDSFMTLFDEDEEKVEKLDELVTAKAGFDKKFFITGQTYSRQQDTKLIFALSNLASVIKKIAHDIRILQSYDEIREPFEAEQIGSSSMPYKRNPMKCERICGLSTSLMTQITLFIRRRIPQGLKSVKTDSLDQTTKKDKGEMAEAIRVSTGRHCLKSDDSGVLAAMKEILVHRDHQKAKQKAVRPPPEDPIPEVVVPTPNAQATAAKENIAKPEPPKVEKLKKFSMKENLSMMFGKMKLIYSAQELAKCMHLDL